MIPRFVLYMFLSQCCKKIRQATLSSAIIVSKCGLCLWPITRPLTCFCLFAPLFIIFTVKVERNILKSPRLSRQQSPTLS